MSTTCQVHNVRFFDLPPRSAHCLAYSRDRNLLALSRADYSIEIWHFGNGNDKQKTKSTVVPVLQRVIPAHDTQGSVEALVWAGGGTKYNNSINNQNNSEIDEDYESDDSSKPPSNCTKNSKPSSTKLNKIVNPQSCINDNRLFSTGLHGLLIEHDLDHLDLNNKDDNQYAQEKQSVWSVTSGAAWCMKYNVRANKLAIGTEEGYVSLFRAGGINGLDFDKVLDKQEGRILCLDWHTDGRHIVTGSPDTIRLWDVVTGHPLTRMSTGRTEKHRETTVWSLIILNDFTVVSGDSRGKTSFWNGKTGTLTDAYQTHIADVLTVATNESESIVYSSGVDPTIMQFQPISTKFTLHVNNQKNILRYNMSKHSQANGITNGAVQKRPKWVKTSHRSTNTHDVRAILCIGKKVLSVGVDANLCISDTISRTLVKYPPIPHGGNVVHAATTSSNGTVIKVALRYENRIEVWNLGQPVIVNPNTEIAPSNPLWSNTYMPLKEDAEKLIMLNTKDNMPIMCFDMASDASALAYITTDSCVRIFCMEFETEIEKKSAPKISRINFQKGPGSFGDCSGPETPSLSRYNIVKFLAAIDESSNLKLLLSTVGGTLQCYDLPTEGTSNDTAATLLWSLSPKENLDLHSGISHLEVHPKGVSCAVADYNGNVRIINIKKMNHAKAEHIQGAEILRTIVHKIPTYNQAVVSSMSFSPKTEGNLIIVYANHHFIEVDNINGKYTEFTNKITSTGKKYRQLPSEWTDKKFPTKGIVFLQKGDSDSKKCEEVLVFYDEVNICSFDKQVWSSNISKTTSYSIQKTPEGETTPSKSAKRNKGSNGIMNNKADLPASMSITKKYEYLAHLGLVNSPTILPCKQLPKDSLAEINGTVDKPTSSKPILVAVEVKPQFLESQLPPSVRQKKFGAM